MSLPDLGDTIAAIATAPGIGAIGIVRIAGPDALRLAGAVFRPQSGDDASALRGGRFYFGTVMDGDRFVDHGLLLVFRAPRSYTGQDAAELQVHGGPAVLQTVLDLCLRHGARQAGPGEFSLRAVLAGKLDLAQAEGVLAMVEARSEAASRQAAVGLSGALTKAIEAARRELTGSYAAVLASLDYPEEGVPEAQVEAPVARAKERLERLLATASAGRFATQGARLAIVGRPNAGKSSLLNALLGYPRAIVSAEAGTTRDYLEAPLALGRISLTAIDTAGLRPAAGAVEASGVERAKELAEAADLVLLLIDGSQPLSEDDRTMLADFRSDRHLWVASKADRPFAWDQADLPLQPPGGKLLRLSSEDGSGLEDLKLALETRLLAEAAAEETWVSSERHADALREAIEALERVPDAPADVQGLELETALRALARMSGGGDVTEETLSEVFSRFCVGK